MSRWRWFDWHSWASVLAGLLMFVVCWSGTVATLSREIDWLLDPALRVTPQAQRASWGEIAAAAQRAHPETKVSSIGAPLYAHAAAEVVMEVASGDSLRVYVDPYTARVQGHTTYFNVQRFFRSFHMSLFDWGGSGAGYYIVCALSLVLLASLVTSLVFYKRWWRGFFTLKRAHGARVFWSDAHKLAGVWSLWFVAAIAVTGGWYLFEMARYQIDPTGSEGQFDVPAAPRAAAAADPLPIDALVARAQAMRPDLEIRGLRPDDGGVFYADGQAHHWLVRDRANAVHLDRRDGNPLLSQDAGELSLYWRWSDTADPLHFGDFAGLPTKVIWCAFGLLMCSLSLSGAYLHHQRILARGADRVAVRRGARTAAAFVALLVMAYSLGGGIVEIGGYAVPGAGNGVATLTPVSVWIFIAGWVAITLAIIAVWLKKLG